MFPCISFISELKITMVTIPPRLQVTTIASMPVDICKTRLQSQKYVNGQIRDRQPLSTSSPCIFIPSYLYALNITRPRRPGFKGHPIEFMIIVDPYLGPLWTHLNPFWPTRTQLSHLYTFSPFWQRLEQFGSIRTYANLFGSIWTKLVPFGAV